MNQQVQEIVSNENSENMENECTLMNVEPDNHDKSRDNDKTPESCDKTPEKMTKNSYLSFLLTYFGYFCLYLIRKPLSTSKPYITQEFKICKKLTLSIADNSHLIPYSLVAILFPNTVDRLGGRLSLFMTFAGAGMSIAAVYFVQFLNFGTNENSNLQFSLLCLCIFSSGCFQAFGWPSAIKGMAEHIPKELSKAILPSWTTCCFLGSTLGGIFLGFIYKYLGSDRNVEKEIENGDCGTKINNTLYLYPDWLDVNQIKNRTNYSNYENSEITMNYYADIIAGKDITPKIDWRMAFLLPPLCAIFMSIVIFLFFPKKSSFESLNQNEQNEQENSSTPKSTQTVPMSKVIKEVPALKLLAISYAFAKGSRYWYFYWAPDWLVKEGGFSVSEASFLSTALDIGSILSLLILGPISTKNKFIKKPIPPLYLAAFSSISCIPVIFLARLVVISKNYIAVSLVLVLLGFVLALSDPIYSGMMTNEAADIDGRNLHASCAGFVNGVGSLGAVILNPLASYMAGLDPDSGYIYALITVACALLVCTFTTVLAHRRLVEAKLDLK